MLLARDGTNWLANQRLKVTLCFSFKASTGLNTVEIAVDVDLQQNSRMVRKPTSFRRNHTIETQSSKVEFIDEHIDQLHRVVSST